MERRDTPPALTDFLASFKDAKDVEILKHLTPHYFPIPFDVVDSSIVKEELPQLWQWILTQIPVDAVPEGDAFHEIRNGEYINSWGVPFYSEAFGRQTDAGTLKGGKLCIVDIDYTYYPNV